MLTDEEYTTRRQWNRTGCALVLFLVFLASIGIVLQIVQPPRGTTDIEFDISKTGEFLLTTTVGLQDGVIGLGLVKPLHIGTGYGAIFGRTPEEIIYSGYIRQGERAMFAFKIGEEPTRLSHPPPGAQDFDCALSRDGRRLFFLRSLRPRTTSMGGVALGDIDLWMLNFQTRQEKQLTHLSMFRADLGPRAALDDSVVFVGWPSGTKTARLMQVDAQGKVRDVIGNPTDGSGRDVMSCTLSEDGAAVYFPSGAFPSKLYSVPLAGGPTKAVGEDKTIWRPLCRGTYVYYQAPVLAGQGIKKLDLRTGSATIVTSLAP